MATEQQQQ